MSIFPDSTHFTDLGSVISWQRLDLGFVARTPLGELLLTADGKGVFRIEVKHDWSPDYVSLSIEGRLSPPDDIGVKELEGVVTLTTQHGVLALTKDPLEITVKRADGSLVFQSCPGGLYRHLNDEFIVRRSSTDAELVLGLGEKTGGLNRRGRTFTLWNTDVLNPNSSGEFTIGLDRSDPRSDPSSTEFDPYYISIPFYQSLDRAGRAGGFFIDNCHRAQYGFEEDGETQIHFAGGRYVEYVFLGPDLASILRDYTELTGRMKNPPLWSLGHHYCRWHPYRQSDVISLAKKFRIKQIPCDSIWLDIDHMDGYRVFTWDKGRYPDPEDMLCDLKRTGYRVVTIVDPGVKVEPGWELYEDGKRNGVFCKTEGGAIYQGQVWPGRTAFPDFASANAREWWGDLNARHAETGLAGIWNDMNEPATGCIPCAPMRFDEGRLSHGGFHNAYATFMAKATYDGLRKALPEVRPFILSRAGSAGIQKYAANWLGDNMARWDHLALSIPMSIGLGLSGQPFVGADIGGFGENSEGELLARWYQAACLSPFCRNHNAAGNIDQYPWSFGSEVEASCRKSLELRYRLMPYLYTAFVQAANSGAPVMRPLAWDYPADEAVRALDDQYLLGDSLLVAPVVTKGALARRVVLPEGEWIDWWTGSLHAAGAVEVDAPIDVVPLFVKAGSVIPLWTEAPASTSDYFPEVIELVVALPNTDGAWQSVLVEDDGQSFDYQTGKQLVTKLTVARSGGSIFVSGMTTGNEFVGFRRKSFRIRILGWRQEAKVVDTRSRQFGVAFHVS